jgi:serine/threonine protein phosphatase PrpC
MVRLLHAARTDVGMIRSGNEDNYSVIASGDRGLFIVADGMGGHAAGEVASEMAVQTVERELSGVRSLEDRAVIEQVREALRKANRNIHDRTITEVDKQGMGTTASVLLVSGNRYLIGQVGDSRVYLLR